MSNYYKQAYLSPIGEMSLVTSDKGLVGVWFVGQKYFEYGLKTRPQEMSHPILNQTVSYLEQYFSGQSPDLIALPLDLRGTDFQLAIWQQLREIPFGKTRTYGQLAQQMGIKSGQAVGGAVGKNPISILIPCHRVLSQSRGLTGYAGGLEKKIWLLQHEKIDFKE